MFFQVATGAEAWLIFLSSSKSPTNAMVPYENCGIEIDVDGAVSTGVVECEAILGRLSMKSCDF
jgi:hypothetical protein